MTKYQAKRQFINKINQRIRTLTKRAGVDIETILNKVESIDGVYVNDPGTGINIDTSYFTPELENRLNLVGSKSQLPTPGSVCVVA